MRKLARKRRLTGGVQLLCCALVVVALCGGLPPCAWAQGGLERGYFSSFHAPLGHASSCVLETHSSASQVSLPANNNSLFAGNARLLDTSHSVKEHGNEKQRGGLSDDPAAPARTPQAIDEAAYRKLFQNIAASFAHTSNEWKALDLAAMGQGSDVNAEELEKAIARQKIKPDSTSFQRGILATTAIGHGATAKDLIAAMAQTPTSQNMTNNQIFALLSYACGPYEVPANHVNSKEELIEQVLSKQLPDGGFTFFGDHADPDMTAMAIFCLEPLISDETLTGHIKSQVAGSVALALQTLQSLQNDDGGFGTSFPDGKPQSNSNSTAMAVVALCSVGTDPSLSWVSASGNTPLSALMHFASPDFKGFLYDGDLNDMSTEQGFRALVSYQGFKNTKGAYSIHTQAKQGQAALDENPDDNADDTPDDTPDNTPDNTPDHNSDNNTPDNNTSDNGTPGSTPSEGDVSNNNGSNSSENAALTDKSTGNNARYKLLKTGDGLAPLAQAAGVLALGSLACAGMAWRRIKAGSNHKRIIETSIQKD